MTTTTDLLRRAAEGMADLAGHCEQLLPPEESYAAQCRADAASLLALADSMTAPVVAQRMPYAGGFTAVVFDDKKVPPGTLVVAIRDMQEPKP